MEMLILRQREKPICLYLFETASLSAEFDRSTGPEETLDPGQFGTISAEIITNTLLSFPEPSDNLTDISIRVNPDHQCQST